MAAQIPECRIVLIIGVAIMLVPLLTMCLFNDRLALGSASDAVK